MITIEQLRKIEDTMTYVNNCLWHLERHIESNDASEYGRTKGILSNHLRRIEEILNVQNQNAKRSKDENAKC